MGEEHTTPVLRVGCRDWERRGLVAAYYPPDLPADWRLAYYANEADCVLVSGARWRAADAPRAAAWAAEVDARFRFYLDGGGAAPPADLVAALGERCGGVLGRAGEVASGAGVLARTASPAGRAWAVGGRAVLCLDDLGGDLRAWRARLETLGAWISGWRELALVLEGEAATPTRARELRTLIELMGLA